MKDIKLDNLCYLILFCFSFNDLVIDDAASNIMNGSSNSNRPNDSSLEDELEDHEDDCKNESKQNGANLSDKTLLVTLVKQINLLHETNSKIFRNLHETKSERVYVFAFYGLIIIFINFKLKWRP